MAEQTGRVVLSRTFPSLFFSAPWPALAGQAPTPGWVAPLGEPLLSFGFVAAALLAMGPSYWPRDLDPQGWLWLTIGSASAC